jgi:hypothetical protein
MGDFKNQKPGEHTQATAIKRVSTLSDDRKYKLRNFLDSENQFTLGTLIKKTTLHMQLFLGSSLALFILFYVFRPEGTHGVYEQSSTAVFSSADNNTLFRSLDSLVPAGDEGRVSDDLNAYSEKAITLVKSSEFIQFCYESALKDPFVENIFKQKGEKIINRDELKARIDDYMRNRIDIVSNEKRSFVNFKNTKGGFNVKFKSKDPKELNQYVTGISKLMSDFIVKKDMEDIQAARTLVQDRFNGAQKDFDENAAKRAALADQVPSYDGIALAQLQTQYSSTKIALSSNLALQKHFEKKINEVQSKIQKLKDLTEKQKDEESLVHERALKGDLNSLYYLKNEFSKQGVDPESYKLKSLNSNLDETSKKLKLVEETYLGDRDEAETNVSTSSYAQNLEAIQTENVFYENKLNELDTALKKMGDNLQKKLTLENQIRALDTMLGGVQRKMESLKNGLARLDVSDFKSQRRISFIYNPVVFSQGASVFSYLIFTGILSLLIGMALALGREIKNPSLTLMSSFEEIGLKVLGGLPSYRNPLLTELDEKYHFYFSKCAINLENTLNFLKSKIALITSVDDSLHSATVGLNLGLYFANTGKKVLIVETDLQHNSLVSLTGSPLDGGLSELSFHEGEVSISPFQFQKGLDVLTGDPNRMPKEFRLASNEFFNLLGELKEQYDFIFIHAKSCLEGSDAADLSRYAGLSLVACDARTIKIDLLEKFVGEMRGFLSKETMFVLDEPEDLLKVGTLDTSKAKVSPASLRKGNGKEATPEDKVKVAA